MACVDARHDLTKHYKVELLPGHCVTLIPDLHVVLMTEEGAAFALASTAFCQKRSKFLIWCCSGGCGLRGSFARFEARMAGG